MRRILLLIVLFSVPCFADSVFVELSDVPADGFVVCPLDITPATNWLETDLGEFTEFYYGEQKLGVAFVPGFDSTSNRGTFVADLPDNVPKGKPIRLRLERGQIGNRALAPQPFTAAAASTKIVFDPEKQSGLPSRITFANGKTLDTMKWFDRLHDPDIGSCNMMNPAQFPSIMLGGRSFHVIPIQTAFQNPDGENPNVQYQWFIFPQRELIYVIASMQQSEAKEWKEKHLLELHIPDGSFGKWFGDDKSGTFVGTKQSQTFSRYSGFLDDDNNIVATIAPGTLLYDGLNDFGPYLIPRGNEAWQPWTDTKHRLTAWYWIGNSSEPAGTLQSAYETVTKMPHAKIVIPALEETARDWKTAALNDLFLSGKIKSKKELEHWRNTNRLPENWIDIERGGLGMILEKADDKEKSKGIRLLSLVDKYSNVILSARESVPLFSAELLDKTTEKIVTINSDEGWKMVDGRRETEALVFTGSHLPEGEDLRIVLKLLINGSGMWREGHLGISWNWQVVQDVDRYEFRKLNFPQIALRNPGPMMQAFYPHASGVVTENPVGKELHWRGTYPSGWCSMPFTAIYDETKNIGLYVATHDSGGSVKDIRLDADSAADSLTIRFEHPLPLVENAERVSHGGGVWQTFHGNWFDAALIYRDFVRKNAEWHPRQKLGPDGRTDTPQWMKELSVWALASDSPEQMPQTMRKFTDALGIPTAVHWYNWHKIPFDNDYPHYFPTKDGFKEAVTEIQKNGDCFVMPYINGRLWDTRDRGMEDFQFTSVALPGATKKEDGKPYTETYGSKESDGSDVELAVMCPAAKVWQDKVTENIFRLINECGVAAVYVDQVAAEKPNLCFDKSHGHPLAGGDWWNREHWKLYEKIRSELPKDRMLTTECNAEPFVNIFDGYLTWHFQYQDQVPAFAAVYGGAVQMFGRAYRGGPSEVLADRMKLAQQLVYGEQIGWIDPRIVDDTRRFPFFKDIVLTRHKYRDYFYKGEMTRPPKLLDEIPTVTADWQWSGEWIITTNAVQTGAWRKTDENGNTISAVFFFVNIADSPITSRVSVRFDELGLESDAFERPLTFEPGAPTAIEVLR